MDIGLDLDVHCVGCTARNVTIDIVCVKITGVEIDADPRAFYRLHNLNDSRGIGDDSAVVFDP